MHSAGRCGAFQRVAVKLQKGLEDRQMTSKAVDNQSIDFKSEWTQLGLLPHVIEDLGAASALYVPETREDLLNWALDREAGETDWRFMNREDKGEFEVAFEVPKVGRVVSKPWLPRPLTGWL
jgi:hypothetical protein